MSIPDNRLAEIEALANKAANPATETDWWEEWSCQSPEEWAFLESVTPAAVLELVAALREAQAERDEMKHWYGKDGATALKAIADLAALRTAVGELADEMKHNVESHNIGALLPPYAKGRRDSYAAAEKRIRSLLTGTDHE